MSAIYKAVAECCPSQYGNESYVYSIVPMVQDGLAAITSAGELLVLDRSHLTTSPVMRLPDVPRNVGCLISGDDSHQTTLCCGADGTVAIHDVRIQARVSHFKLDKALTALARKDHVIAVGTELANHQAVVSVWDQRQFKPIWQNTENNDDITALDFHPSKGNILLAGGDDGQVSIFDTFVAEEDDSLIQGVNHGPIHKAGFLGDHRFFALSSDQNFSVHPFSLPDDEHDPQPTLLGDLRPVIPCEYVIDVFRTGELTAIAAGSNISDSQVKIVEVVNAADPVRSPGLATTGGYILQGGHGEEVVRSLTTDEASGTIFTAGEDGVVKAFQNSSTSTATLASEKPKKSKKMSEGRYKPY